MAKTMTPSESITAGQIGKIQEILGAGLRKSGFQSEPVQMVLETQGDSLVIELVAVIRKRVEMVSNIITRHVVIDRSRTPQEMITLTGRVKWYIDPVVLAEMPRDGFDEGKVEIFELDYDVSVDQLDNEYESGHRVQDPYAVFQALIDDPTLADERPIAVQWRDKRDRACCALFRRFGGGREVHVSWRDSFRWLRHYRFAGSRK
ncbi:MAG: hypothetical protein ABIF06_00430 [bacterium]